MFEFCRIDLTQSPFQPQNRALVRDEVELQVYPGKNIFACFRPQDGDAEPLPIPNCKERWRWIVDPNDNRRWWFLAANDPQNGRLVSELDRSVGVVETKWSNGSSLKLRVECATLPENAVQATLKDFVGDLVYIIISKNNPLEHSLQSDGPGTLRLSPEDRQRFSDLVALLEALLKDPSTKLMVDRAPMASHKLKPTPSNLRCRLRRPDASVLWGERITEHLDTGENRFMHATAIRCLRIISAAIDIETQSESSSDTDDKSIQELKDLRNKFAHLIRIFRERKIGSDRKHFNRIVMQGNRRYAKVYSLQKDIFANMVQWSEIGDLLAQTRKFRITHLSQIYERWCLIKIIRTLIYTYRFRPVGNWIDGFIRDVMQDKHNVDVRLHHPDYGYDIIVSYEHELDPSPFDGKIYRPDFVIQLDGIDAPKLVLDAKFRTRLGKIGVEELHEELYSKKNYAEDQENLVFIIQPANPKAYYYDCLNWTGGGIYALAGQEPVVGRRDHFRLALLQWFQSIEYRYRIDGNFRAEHPNPSQFKICPNCGASGKHLNEFSTSSATTKMTCSECNQIRLWTHCFSCHQRPLIKNPGLNYFKTNGSECNVVCPNCHQSFEGSSRRIKRVFPDDDVCF